MTTCNYNAPWLEISLSAIATNASLIKNSMGGSPSRLIAVVKDNAYGLGAIPIAKHLHSCGIDFFAVAHYEEALELRNNGITDPILILGQIDPALISECAHQNIRLSLNDITDLTLFSNAQTPISIHCHVDTGMNRMGISPTEAECVASTLATMPNLSLEGLYTHFASADDHSCVQTNSQVTLFNDVIKIFAQKGMHPTLIHAANTAGILRHSANGTNAFRSGIGLYGCSPDPYQQWKETFTAVVSLRAKVVTLRTVAKNTPVSYGATYVTKKETTLATINIGYASGIPRRLSNNFYFIINGTLYPIAGRVTMDYIVVDIGNNSDVKVGNTATIIGTNGSHAISVDDMARSCQTIGYEILCGLSAHIQRRYFINDSEVFLDLGKEKLHG
jgi:alanine racemase